MTTFVDVNGCPGSMKIKRQILSSVSGQSEQGLLKKEKKNEASSLVTVSFCFNPCFCVCEVHIFDVRAILGDYRTSETRHIFRKDGNQCAT